MSYAPVRSTFIMRVLLTGPPAPTPPAGVTFRTYVPGADDEALFQAGEAAFADLWGRPPGTLEGWIAPSHAEGFDAGLWFLATDPTSGEVVGLCLAQMTQGEGWIRTLGVRREARRRGLGRALLETAFLALYQRGARTVELSVDADSPTNAPSVYRRAGMKVHRTVILYQKELRPGRDLSTVS
jgi:mycothiol synthase